MEICNTNGFWKRQILTISQQDHETGCWNCVNFIPLNTQWCCSCSVPSDDVVPEVLSLNWFIFLPLCPDYFWKFGLAKHPVQLIVKVAQQPRTLNVTPELNGSREGSEPSGFSECWRLVCNSWVQVWGMLFATGYGTVGVIWLESRQENYKKKDSWISLFTSRRVGTKLNMSCTHGTRRGRILQLCFSQEIKRFSK